MHLSSCLHLGSKVEALHIEGRLTEVADLLDDGGGGHCRGCWVGQNTIHLVEVCLIEGDIVPVFLECLLGHLGHTFDYSVHVDRKVDCDGGRRWLHGACLVRDLKGWTLQACS